MKKKSVRKLTMTAGMAVLLTAAVLEPGAGLMNSSQAVAAEVSAENTAKKLSEAPVFQEASVHDPSVIKVGDTFYVFGSHLAAAKTKDFMKWDMIASGVKDGNKLIPNVTEELKDTLSWAQSDTLWAPDVIQLADGKFYMYYNACKGDSPRSALGVAVADNVEGPYKDLGIILKSGMWGETGADGTIYDATKHPNVVDSDVFFDKTGKLWMVYGSYSGGIFILRMDPSTGKPLPDQGYGKKLTGGNHSRIEGPYMLYSPETDYYYLFLSFGGLDANGGYNMRVARSRTPDGPFLDADGNDMLQAKANPSLPLFDDRSVEPYGVKLMGNYLFKRDLGDPGQGIGTGYVSPGHNSAYYDSKTGKYYLIFHSRFPSRGEEHEIRVHEMYMNANGWPVVAPYRYAGDVSDKMTAKPINKNDIAGEYKFINHGKEITSVIKESVSIVLDKKGGITGDVTGKWKITGSNKAEITVDGVQYSGVFTYQWNPDNQQNVLTFSALSNKGESIWGSRIMNRSDKQIVEAVQKDLNLGDTSGIYNDLALPVSGAEGSVISWTSSAPEVVSANGTVNRPAAGSGNATVTLKAVITKGKAREVKNVQVVVLQQSKGPLVASYSLDEDKGSLIQDSSPNHYQGKLNGGVSWDAQSVNEARGGSLNFGGKDGYVQLSGALADAEDFTFAAWVNWAGGSDWQRIFDIGNGMNSFMFLTPSQYSGVLQFTIHEQGIDQSLLSATPLPKNEWSHVAVTLEGNTGKLYVNGKLVATNTGMSFNPKELKAVEAYLGKSRFAADAYFGGRLDDIQFYNKALTEQEISTLSEK
ncbi:family 43 glycosylhydrolase [Paenibacillus sp. SN-8-1]|uniref:family 43 glycosylhydrolase n=1 Tax=Paenibacillus sp. SN-8-1 TaxID=3435409 RepID=UPI003D9A4E50